MIVALSIIVGVETVLLILSLYALRKTMLALAASIMALRAIDQYVADYKTTQIKKTRCDA